MLYIFKRTFILLCFLVMLLLSTHFSCAIPTYLATPSSVTMPVIMYHSINSNRYKQDTYVLYSGDFKEDIEFLRANGFSTITVSELVAYVENGSMLPPKPIMLTFDDGYYNNLTNVYPVLRSAGYQGIISIIGIEAERYTKIHDTHESYASLNWEHIRKLKDSGVIEFANHSYNLHNLNSARRGCTKLSGESPEHFSAMLKKDIESSQLAFCKNINFKPIAFAYPFGANCKEARDIIAKNFSASFGVEAKSYTAIYGDKTTLYNIPRFIRTPKISLKKILTQNGFL